MSKPTATTKRLQELALLLASHPGGTSTGEFLSEALREVPDYNRPRASNLLCKMRSCGALYAANVRVKGARLHEDRVRYWLSESAAKASGAEFVPEDESGKPQHPIEPLIEAIAANPGKTRDQLAAIVGMVPSYVSALLTEAKAAGRDICYYRDHSVARWFIGKEPPAKTDSDEFLAMRGKLLKLANNPGGTKPVAFDDARTAVRVAAELKRRGELYLVKSPGGSYYFTTHDAARQMQQSLRMKRAEKKHRKAQAARVNQAIARKALKPVRPNLAGAVAAPVRVSGQNRPPSGEMIIPKGIQPVIGQSRRYDPRYQVPEGTTVWGEFSSRRPGEYPEQGGFSRYLERSK